jgi:predicted nucleotidyltransferase
LASSARHGIRTEHLGRHLRAPQARRNKANSGHNSAKMVGRFSSRLEIAMKRFDVLAHLAQSKPVLAARYGVTDLALFGSTARDSAEPGSDIDVLVAFDGPATSKRYFGVQFYLEDLFNCEVDLVTSKALRAELRPFVERDALHV